ncbi:MAG: polysaccharide deacetylase family protein [Candidatus Latescibacterota bacterium]|nr:polysaccharide deacetylase family protein [Candidatus Latescibacterota bacterium]
MTLRVWTATLRNVVALAHPDFFFKRIMAGQRGIEGCCTVSFDCDFPRDIEVLPQLVDKLDHYGISATFACIGQWIRAFPEEHRVLAAAGHEIINHTETHPNLYHPGFDYSRDERLNRMRFNEIGPSARREEIERCHGTFAEVLDMEPIGFRTPHFGSLHVEDVYPVLDTLGYRFSSSVVAGNHRLRGRPFKVGKSLWELPVSPCPRHPFGVLDSWHSLANKRAWHKTPGAMAGLFSELVDLVQAQGGLVNVYFDPCDMLASGELDRVLEVLQASGMPVVSYGDLADQLDRAQCA